MAVSRVLLARTQPNPNALIKEHRTSQNALNCDHWTESSRTRISDSAAELKMDETLWCFYGPYYVTFLQKTYIILLIDIHK